MFMFHSSLWRRISISRHDWCLQNVSIDRSETSQFHTMLTIDFFYWHWKFLTQVLRSYNMDEFLGITERITTIRALLGPDAGLLSSSSIPPAVNSTSSTPSSFSSSRSLQPPSSGSEQLNTRDRINGPRSTIPNPLEDRELTVWPTLHLILSSLDFFISFFLSFFLSFYKYAYISIFLSHFLPNLLSVWLFLVSFFMFILSSRLSFIFFGS